MALGASRWADSLARVTIEFLRPVPAVALVPVAVISFGLEIGMQVFLIGFACVWPVLVGTRHGVRAIDPLMIDSARMLGLSRRDIVTRVSLPATAPAIATGVRLAASLGVVVAVATEIVTGSPGLGQYLTQAQQAGDDAAAFAAVLVSGLLGLTVNALFVAGENRVAGWQQQSTEGRR
jgi:NitT/TauT family transport system permease protein